MPKGPPGNFLWAQPDNTCRLSGDEDYDLGCEDDEDDEDDGEVMRMMMRMARVSKETLNTFD